MKHILYAADSRFFNQLYISAFSLCQNQRSQDYVLHVIEEDFTEEQKDRLRGMAEAHGQALIFYRKPELPAGTTVSFGRSRATYYRLSAAALLPDTVEKVLYLDGDTVIEDSLDELFALDLGESEAAAVQDVRKAEDLAVIGLTPADCYLNAGVLLLNLTAWRKKHTETRCADYLAARNYSLPYNDQDVLNAVCHGKMRILPLRYNVMIPVLRFTSEQIQRWAGIEKFYPEKERLEAARHPAVIHYAGTPFDRPWNDVCDHPLKDRFWFYAAKAELSFSPVRTETSGAARLRRKLFRALPVTVQLGIRTMLRR